MKILVSGATGFIGKKLVVFLKQKQCEVKIISRTQQSDATIICDLLKEDIPQQSFNNIDTVLHLAGIAHDTRDDYQITNDYQRLNVDATVKLANQAIKAGVKKFIFLSSVKAGVALDSNNCSDENDPCYPEGIYGKSKREAEIKLLDISKKSSMRVSIIRPSLVYGPCMKGNLRLMLLGIKKGWFPPIPESGNRRSLIHVDDLVRAIWLITNHENTDGEIFIATDGTPRSSREIYNTMCVLLGKKKSNWSIPKLLLNLSGMVNKKIKYKIDKLLGNECYSSEKLESLGFKPKKCLEDMNETDF